MLANTFCHIPRVSVAKERALWDQGVMTWDDYRKIARRKEPLDDSERHLASREPAFFANRLQSDQHWRLFADFRDSVAYVDIETTGLDKSKDEITTIALYDGCDVRTYVHGRNLEQFKKDIAAYKLLVTFNGKCFDAPFLERRLGTQLPGAHIDLRYVMKRLGYAGGLKAIEHELGIDRGDLRDVDGFFAVSLWHEYRRRANESALETLLAYNCADALNLEPLMVMAYNANVRTTPFGREHALPEPLPKPSPFRADPKLVSRLMWS